VTEGKAEAGHSVKAGQLLMRIDSREAAENAAAAQARLIQAEAEYQRTRRLQEQKFVSQAAVDRAEAEFKAARAQAGGASAGLSHGSITAPMAGVVGQRFVEAGDLAVPGKPLITVFDPKSLRLVASIPQATLGDLRGVKKARVEFPESGRWLDAARVEVLPTVDAVTRSATVRVYLADNVAGIAPGMFARVHLITGQGRKLLVPATAVVRRGEVTGVYVVDDKQMPRLRQVRVGETFADGIEILAGIASGERIALDAISAGQRAARKP
jgi:RND family efflux transporter MFP subunit